MDSRRLLMAEAVLLLAPATVLAGLGFVWSARFLAAAAREGAWGDPTMWMAVAIAAGLVGTLCGWWLLVRFWRGGVAALARGTGMVWMGAGMGLVAATAGAYLTAQGNGWIFSIGLPAIVPMAHLWQLRRTASD